jgi:hypothetical protein
MDGTSNIISCVTDSNIVPRTFGEWGVKFSLLGEEQLTKAQR